jgi:metallo-beta-lactamase class B
MKHSSVVIVWLCLMSLTNALAQPLKIQRLTDSVYVYTTYKPFNGQPFPSNSLYMVSDAGIVMIDTPWDTTQTQPLLDSIQHRHHQGVAMCLVTHFHDDRTGGLDILKRNGIATYSTLKTHVLCVANNEKQAEHIILNDTAFVVGRTTFETFYPGEGHTSDNIVVWFAREKVLYGGCLVKSIESKGLGNVADANVSAWSQSIDNVMRKYGKAKFVVPGHQNWSSTKALKHTKKLLAQNRNAK